MKFAFSNLACPAWTISQVAEGAASLGYDAVELRLLDGQVIDPAADRARVIDAVALCRSQGVEVCALATSCTFNHAHPVERARNIEDALRWIALAQETAVPLLRVFGGAGRASDAATSMEQVNDWVVEALRQAAPAAEQAAVTLMLETHDAFSSARRVAEVLENVASDRVAALWDSHHPFRMGETVAEAYGLLNAHLAHVHVKDAIRSGPGVNDWQLVLLGEGEVPVREMLGLLEQGAYAGYVCVEWEKKWHPELADPEVALPQHIAWLKGSA